LGPGAREKREPRSRYLDEPLRAAHEFAMGTQPASSTRRSSAGTFYGVPEAIVLVALATLAGLAMAPRWGAGAVDLLFLPAVLGAALLGGLYPALLSALLSALAYNYFFTAPQRSLHVDNPADLVTVLVLFLVAVVASRLAASVREQARIAASHAARNATIAGFARRLLSCGIDAEIARVATDQLATLLRCNAMLVRRGAELEVLASSPAPATLGPSDAAAAILTLETGERAGRAVTRANTAEWQFHPIRAEAVVIAVLGLARDDGAAPVAPEQMALVQNLTDQIALALERARVESEARDFAATRARDRMRSALLSTIAQDLMPGVTTILDTVDRLRRGGSSDKEVVSEMSGQAWKLRRYISNLADLGLDTDREPVAAGDVTIDLFRRSVCRGGTDVHLPPKEYALLAELAKHPGRVLTHAHLLRAVWGPAQEHQTDYLRVAVRGLRQKLEADPTRPRLIVNEPAVGYRLVAD
jgi:two-component system sensor histidine kinase KdpD